MESLFNKQCLNFLRNIANSILTGKDVQQTYYNGLINFYSNFYKKWGYFKPLGKIQSVEVSKIYTAVKIIEFDDYLRNFKPEELVIQHHESKEKNLVPLSNKQPGIDVAEKNQLLNVLGQPGAGKTTFLKFLGITALLQKNAPSNLMERIPFFLELKDTTFLQNTSIYGAIEQQFLDAKIPTPGAFANNLLEKGKFLILLDGLDEVPIDKVNQVVNSVIDFVNRYPENRFITSCRTKFYKGNFYKFKDVIVADFDRNQIKNFIDNWFQNQMPENSQILWDILNSNSHESTLELSQTPLLLTFICVVFEVNQRLPKIKGSLYRDALEILLRRWAAAKGVFRGNVWEFLDPELEIIMLSKISYDYLKEDKIFFTKYEISNQIGTFLADEMNSPDQTLIDAQSVLDSIEVKQGILVQRYHDVYSFSHLTLQEYLAANHIKEYGLINELVYKYLESERWREVFVLLSGLIHVDKMLINMANQASTLINKNQEFLNITKWINNALAQVDNPLEFAANKAIALHLYTCIGVGLPSSNPFDYMELVNSIYKTDFPLYKFHTIGGIEIAHILKEEGIFRSLSLIYDNEDINPILKILQVPYELCSTTYSTNKAISDYLRIWFLILECKNSALSLKRGNWDKVASRFLFIS